VPTDERVGLDVHQGVTPGEQAAQNYHNQPSGIIGTVWLELALLEQGELFTQEEVLGCQRAARPRNEYEEMDEIARYGRHRHEGLCQRLKDGAGHERPALHVTRLSMTANWRLSGISADHRLLRLLPALIDQGGPRDFEQPRRSPCAELVCLLHPPRQPASSARLYSFFERISCRIWRSRERSTTSRFNQEFSS
jgi:hypothetical protein